MAIQESLKVSEQELHATRQAGRELQASYVSKQNEEQLMSAKLTSSEAQLRLVESSLKQAHDKTEEVYQKMEKHQEERQMEVDESGAVLADAELSQRRLEAATH